MQNEKELLYRLIEEMATRRATLITALNSEPCNSTSESLGALGSIKELDYQIKALYGYIDQIDDRGFVLMDSEIPF